MVVEVGADEDAGSGGSARDVSGVVVDGDVDVDVGDGRGVGAKMGAVVEAGDVDVSARVRATVDVVSARGGGEVGTDGDAEVSAGVAVDAKVGAVVDVRG